MTTRKHNRHPGRRALRIAVFLGLICTAPITLPALAEAAGEALAPSIVGMLMPG